MMDSFRRLQGQCRCGWKSAESFSRSLIHAERSKHEDTNGGYPQGHLTYTSWRETPRGKVFSRG